MKSNKKLWAGIILTAALLLILFFWLVLKGSKTPRPLTIEDVYSLSQKEDITWPDLSPYAHGRNTGSGLYILMYKINEKFYLLAGGMHPEFSPSDQPLSYVRLCYKADDDSFIDNDECIDIQTNDVKEFYEKYRK